MATRELARRLITAADRLALAAQDGAHVDTVDERTGVEVVATAGAVDLCVIGNPAERADGTSQ